MRVGAFFQKNKCHFNVWAPFKNSVNLRLNGKDVPMKKIDTEYWSVSLPLKGEEKYYYNVDGKIRPDPASKFQPEGVHGPSQVINDNFSWEDKKWKAPKLRELIIYELHVGTFTKEGTFKAIISKLEYLKKIGINAIEIMPVAQFPGDRNWGYDGVYPFAVQNSYGTPKDFKALVNECHKKGIAVILDVVYNHLGPEGNYFRDFGPYFTDKYKTPWGCALNFDDSYSDGVRNYFINNALYWLEEFHIDGLRLDAVQTIFDTSARPFLQELAEIVEKRYPNKYLIAESNLNKSSFIKSRRAGGYGLDAEWLDDFHHSLHAYITDEKHGYYIDYGKLKQIAKCINKGHVYDGIYSMSRKCTYGDSSGNLDKEKFVVFIQNHDQVGNRVVGERLSKLVDFAGLKTSAGLMLCSPFVPLLFMGEEYGETTPFFYFTNHSDKELGKAVKEGRKNEFKEFDWKEEPPDPQSHKTFNRSKLDWKKINNEKQKKMLEFYKDLIRLRKNKKFGGENKTKATSYENKGLITISYGSGVFVVFNLGEQSTEFYLKGNYRKIFDSEDEKYNGRGSDCPKIIKNAKNIKFQKRSFIVFERRGEYFE